METAAYYTALLTVVCVPPAISLWFLIHPLAHIWRRIGPVATYLIVLPLLIAFGAGIYGIREPLLRVRYGVSLPLSVLGVILLAVGFYIGIRRMPYLTISVLVGVPELSKEGEKGKLLTEGIYSIVRHPRYLEIGFVLAGIAFMVNYLVVYMVVISYVPVIYLVVLLEERELRRRFGEDYERYCRRVPRFIPKFRRG